MPWRPCPFPRARDVGSDEEKLNRETEDASFFPVAPAPSSRAGWETTGVSKEQREKKDREKTSKPARRDDKDNSGIEIPENEILTMSRKNNHYLMYLGHSTMVKFS